MESCKDNPLDISPSKWYLLEGILNVDDLPDHKNLDDRAKTFLQWNQDMNNIDLCCEFLLRTLA